MNTEVNEKNAQALAESLKIAHTELGKCRTDINQQNITINTLNTAVEQLKIEILMIKANSLGSGPTEPS